MEAFTELYSQLGFADQNGQKLQRIQMEQQIREKFPAALRWAVLAIGYGMDQSHALLAPPVFTLHWLLDEMVRRQQLDGDVFGLPPEAHLNAPMMTHFTQQLDVAIQTGQAMSPAMGEGVDMSKPAAPPTVPSQFPTVPGAAPSIPAPPQMAAPAMPAPFQVPAGIPAPPQMSMPPQMSPAMPPMPASAPRPMVPQMPTAPASGPPTVPAPHSPPPGPVPPPQMPPAQPPARATSRRKAAEPAAPQPGVPQMMPGVVPGAPVMPQMPQAAPQFAPQPTVSSPAIDPNQLRQIVREELGPVIGLVEKVLARGEGVEATVNAIGRYVKKMGMVAGLLFRYWWFMPDKLKVGLPTTAAHLDLEQTLTEIGFKDPQ